MNTDDMNQLIESFREMKHSDTEILDLIKRMAAHSEETAEEEREEEMESGLSFEEAARLVRWLDAHNFSSEEIASCFTYIAEGE